MNQAKYIGMDVHQATISVAVMDSAGKLILESILETKAATILQFLAGLRGSLLVTFEEGTSAAWLYDLSESEIPAGGFPLPKTPFIGHSQRSSPIGLANDSDLVTVGHSLPWTENLAHCLNPSWRRL